MEPYRAIQRLDDRDLEPADAVRYVRVTPPVDEYRERSPRYGIDLNGDGRVDLEYDTTLPTYLI